MGRSSHVFGVRSIPNTEHRLHWMLVGYVSRGMPVRSVDAGLLYVGAARCGVFALRVDVGAQCHCEWRETTGAKKGPEQEH